MNTLFIVDGPLNRPLLHSQGLPLLRQLSLTGVHCFILSFETDVENAGSRALRDELQQKHIAWLTVNVAPHVSARQRAQTLWRGFQQAWQICATEKINIVHCRSYRPAVIGAFLKLILKVGFLFDMRGLLIDELIAAGRWRRGSLKERVARLFETFCVKTADALVTTSPQFRTLVLEKFPIVNPDRVISIPNCVDMQRFRRDSIARVRVRKEKNWSERWVLAFAGDAERYQQSFGDLLYFFKQVRLQRPDALLAFFAYGDSTALRASIQDAGWSEKDVEVMSVAPSEIPAYLSAVDVGLAFFQIINAALAIASPVKFAEYLACGLPVVINPGVGDTGRILKQYQVGVVAEVSDRTLIQSGVDSLIALVKDPDLSQRCRQAAQAELSLEQAVQYYQGAYGLVA